MVTRRWSSPLSKRSETEEEAYWHIIEGIGLPIESYNDFVDMVRMYYPPLHQNKFIQNNGFWTPSGKVECNSSILRELGYSGMPIYTGMAESELTTPEVAAEYPIVLTTGGGFMPYHHSEHFNMQAIRYLYPDPYFFINPKLAESLGIEQSDWCWIETRRGRIKMRASVEPIVDPRVVMCPRGWWFPERDGSADLNNPFGCLESNVNTLTCVDDPDCDPMGGSWNNRGLMCKVYKCGEVDATFTAQDAQFSIPGNAPTPGIHTMPSDMKLCREPIPFEAPQPTKEVPEGYVWTWQDDQIYQKGTGFRLDDSGWLVDPKDKGYVDAYTGWRYDANQDCLVDVSTGTKYDMNRNEITEIAGIRTYPGQDAPYEIAGQALVWDKEKGYATFAGAKGEGKIFNPDTQWVIGLEDNVYYDQHRGYAYDPTDNTLVDMETGLRYTMNYEQITGNEELPVNDAAIVAEENTDATAAAEAQAEMDAAAVEAAEAGDTALAQELAEASSDPAAVDEEVK